MEMEEEVAIASQCVCMCVSVFIDSIPSYARYHTNNYLHKFMYVQC